jgi:hypothetical protein
MGGYGSFFREAFGRIGDIVPVSGIQVFLRTMGKGIIKRIILLGSSQGLASGLHGRINQSEVLTLGRCGVLIIDYAARTPEQ